LSAAEKKILKKLNENLVGSTMDKKLFADLVESMQQHNEIIAGTRKPARTTKVDAQSIKVLRARAGLTQETFAALIQVDLSTLRNWEQGRREPTGPAKALIRAITNDPKHVLKALEVGATMRKAG
jgi:putative transcriptional regulator